MYDTNRTFNFRNEWNSFKLDFHVALEVAHLRKDGELEKSFLLRTHDSILIGTD